MKFASVTALAAFFAFSTTANAAIYTLVPTTPGVNQISIFQLGQINVNVDLSGSLAISQNNSGTDVDDFTIDGGTITTTPINFHSFGLGSVTSTPLSIGATSVALPVTNPGGTFDASGISLTFNGGVIAVNIPFISPNFINLDFGTSPVDFGAGGTGTMLNTGFNEYTMTIPINFATVLDPNGLAVPVGIIGSIVAVGVIPEPASGLFLACMGVGAGTVVRRRRR